MWMVEKQYRLNKWGTRLLKNNRPLFDWANESDNIVDLLNEQDKTIKELDKHCISQEDTLTTILEYTDALLRGLDFDLFVKEYFEIIRNLEMDRMNAFIREFAVGDDENE